MFTSSGPSKPCWYCASEKHLRKDCCLWQETDKGKRRMAKNVTKQLPKIPMITGPFKGAQYSDLPNELLLIVLSFLDPADIEAFQVVSRRNYIVSSEHRELREKWSIVHDTNLPNLHNLLEMVLLKPQMAWYTRRIVLGTDHKWFTNDKETGETILPHQYADWMSEKGLPLISAASKESTALLGLEHELIEDSLGSIGTALVLLLNITTLHYTSSYLEDDFADRVEGAVRIFRILPKLSEIRLSYVSRIHEEQEVGDEEEEHSEDGGLQREENPRNAGLPLFNNLPTLYFLGTLKTLHVNIELLRARQFHSGRYGGFICFNRKYFPRTVEKLKISGKFQSWVNRHAIFEFFCKMTVIATSKDYPNLRTICVASLADAWSDQEERLDPYKRRIAKRVKDTCITCMEANILLIDRILPFEDDSGGPPCPVCNDAPAVVDANGKKWSPCRSD